MKDHNTAITQGIGLRDKIGYAMGDIASCLLFGLVQGSLQKYYTDVLGLSAMSIMLMFVIARIWDAINDPIWGRIIDCAPVHGADRYRRWIRIFMLPVAAAAVLMFVKIPGLSQKGYLLYAYITYILFGMLYTCITIPYGSLAQVITSEHKEHGSLSVFRSVGAIIGMIPPMFLTGLCYITKSGKEILSGERILIGVIIIAPVSVLFYSVCYHWSRERVITKPCPEKHRKNTLTIIRYLIKCRPFISICLASMFFLAAEMFSQAYNTYLFPYYFHAPELSMLPAICWYLPALAMMAFASKLSDKFGRRKICSLGMLVSGSSMLIIYFLNTHNVWVYLAGCLASGIGCSFMLLLVWALAADAIDHVSTAHGLHDEATCYSFFSFMRKLGQTVEAILVNLSLMRIGYTDNVLNTDKITQGILDQMYTDSVLIPAILFLINFMILSFFYSPSE